MLVDKLAVQRHSLLIKRKHTQGEKRETSVCENIIS